MRLIDADALSDWMKDYGQKYIKGEREISLMYIWKHIQDMPTIEPSAQPERPKGEWVLQSDDYHEYYECDQCGMAVGLDDVRNFCCNCGTDMRGKQDE